MKQRQIDRMMKRVPAIAHLLHLANQRWKHDSTKDRINIKTKRADQDLLFHSPEPFWRWMIPDSKMVGVVSEIISAVAGREIVDSTGSLDPRHGGRSKVVRQLLAETQANIDLLVRAEVFAWYQNDGNCRPGQFVEREIQFSVYPAPTKGFHDLLSTCDVVKNVHLRIPGMVSYIRADDLTFAEVGTRLEELAFRFLALTYARGLQDRIQQSDEKGMSGQFGSTRLSAWATLGQVMLTFRSGDDEVSFVAAEHGNQEIGFQSINATLPSATRMVEEVIQQWMCSDLPLKERFKDDPSVSL